MRLRLEPRQAASPWLDALIPPLAVLATVVASGVLFAVMGYPVWQTMRAFFITPLASAMAGRSLR